MKSRFISNVHYSLSFKNKSNFKIWGNWGFLAAATYGMGWHSKKGYSKNIYTNSKAWLWCTINNGAYLYINKYCPKYGINKPPHSLRIWTLKMKGNYTGITPMLRHISLSYKSLSDFLITMFALKKTRYVSVISPDIFILKDFKDTQDTYSTIFHELAHASHYTKAGKRYWLHYIIGIIDNSIRSKEGAYGDGSRKNDAYIGVGEMWGYYFGYICEKDEFGVKNVYLNPTKGWYSPGILRDLDNKLGLTPKKIFNCLSGSTVGHKKLKNKLIEKYGNEKDIRKTFRNYGF